MAEQGGSEEFIDGVGAYNLIPSDEIPLTPDEAVAAAVASSLGDPTLQADAGPRPFGASWALDGITGGLITRGNSPVSVSGLDALRSWAIIAIKSVRYAHAIFPDDFGMVDPTSGIGDVAPQDALADYEDRLRDALTQHDRIIGISQYEAIIDNATDVVIINFAIITDQQDELTLSGVRVS